jgi:hypothetical protein
MRDGAPELLSSLLGALDPELRAAAVFALGCLIHSSPRVGPGGAPLPYGGGGSGSGHSSSAASLGGAAPGLGAAGGSAANLGAAAAGAGSTGGAPDGSGGAAAAAALESSIASEQSIAALLLRANVSGCGRTRRVLGGRAALAAAEAHPSTFGPSKPHPPIPPPPKVVYDASALVRCELAAALARLVRGHMPLLEDAIAALRVGGGGAGRFGGRRPCCFWGGFQGRLCLLLAACHDCSLSGALCTLF